MIHVSHSVVTDVRIVTGCQALARFLAPVGCVRFHTEDTCIWQTDHDNTRRMV